MVGISIESKKIEIKFLKLIKYVLKKLLPNLSFFMVFKIDITVKIIKINTINDPLLLIIFCTSPNKL